MNRIQSAISKSFHVMGDFCEDPKHTTGRIRNRVADVIRVSPPKAKTILKDLKVKKVA